MDANNIKTNQTMKILEIEGYLSNEEDRYYYTDSERILICKKFVRNYFRRLPERIKVRISKVAFKGSVSAKRAVNSLEHDKGVIVSKSYIKRFLGKHSHEARMARAGAYYIFDIIAETFDTLGIEIDSKFYFIIEEVK